MNYSGFMGGLFALTEWIMRLVIINILWMITNLPIILIVLAIIFSPSTTAMFILAIPVVILMPILFFPSTVSVFANVRGWIMDKEQHSLLKGYWMHLIGNYKQSVSIGVILTLLWVVWAADFYFFNSIAMDLPLLVMVIVGVGLFVYTMNVFNLNVHYVSKKKELFKNALLITLGRPMLFLFIFISNALLIYMSITKVWFLFPLFLITISSFLTFYAFYRFTLKMEEIKPNGVKR